MRRSAPRAYFDDRGASSSLCASSAELEASKVPKSVKLSLEVLLKSMAPGVSNGIFKRPACFVQCRRWLATVVFVTLLLARAKGGVSKETLSRIVKLAKHGETSFL